MRFRPAARPRTHVGSSPAPGIDGTRRSGKPAGRRGVRSAARALAFALPAAAAAVAWLAAGAAPALAHGDAVPSPPGSIFDLLGGWSFDVSLQVPILLGAAAYIWAFRHVNAAHPRNPVPARRLVYWLGGLAVLEIALQSSIDEYEGVLFTVHMVQHILLIFGAAPLLVLGGPITLLLRVARPSQRQGVILPILHSGAVRFLANPVVAWLFFAATMWGTHFSPIFDLSLENPLVHDIEHGLYLASAMLFWWPVAAVDPSPWRMPHPARIVYCFLQMPQNSFLGLAIYSATTVLYPHYATSGRAWGPSPLADQQLAGGIMWVAGDLIFLVVLLLEVVVWANHEDRQAKIEDARADAAEALLREREARLAERRAREVEDGSQGAA